MAKSKRKKQKKSVKPVRKKKRGFLFRVVLILAVLACAVGTGAFLLIDPMVRERLASPRSFSIPALYGEVFEMTPSIKRATLEHRLGERRYLKVEESPQHPGEYFANDSQIEIYARQFVDAHGKVFEARKISMPWNSPKSFFLEPPLVASFGDGQTRDQEYLSLDQFPPYVIQAVLSIEDERFFSHFGIDPVAIARAVFTNLSSGKLLQGGSTLTQQLAKNLFLSSARTMERKFIEVFAALSLERQLDKKKILELYLNEVYLGQEGNVAIHGFPSASRTFFGKQAQNLSLSESALFAGMIQAPSAYSPRRNPNRAKQRQAIVLRKMHELGFITAETLQTALKEPLTVLKEQLHQRRVPYFQEFLNQNLTSVFNLEYGIPPGAKIFSSIDLGMQACGEQAVKKELEILEKKFPNFKKRKQPLEAGLLVLEPFSGTVKAWVGGRDFATNQYDHVVQASRPIGSTIKPFLYLTALDGTLNSYKVATPVSILSDEPLSIAIKGSKTWRPENYDHRFRGDVTLRYALENSLNIPAVSILQRIGVPSLVATLKSVRLAKEIPAVPSLALGSIETTLLSLTSAFGALANGGVFVPPRPIISVLGRDGTVLRDYPLEEQRIAQEAPVFVLNNILQGVVDRGTARGIRARGYTRPVAGKTGTTNDSRDAWFVGFTPDLVVGVWVGLDDNKPIHLTGGAAAVPIWANFMNCIAPSHETSDFIMPPGVEFLDIDYLSGELATEQCPQNYVVRELFVTSSAPTVPCALHSPRKEREESSGKEPEGEKDRSFWDKLFGQ